MDSSAPTIKQIIITWSDSYDNRIPIPKDQRQTAYIELLKTFVDYGYRKSDVTTTVFNEIVSESVPENHKPLSKKLTWKRIAERDLSSALERVFPSVKLATVTDEDLAPTRATPTQDYVDDGREIIVPNSECKADVVFDTSLDEALGFDE